MYRDIFFRAWIKDRQEMHKVDELVWGEDGMSRWVRIGDHLLDPTRVELMEYTGVKDAKDQMVFEGDILRLDKNMSEVAGAIEENKPSNEAKPIEYVVVKWESYGGFSAKHFNVASAAKDAEVIGNIYENKDLLDIIK